MKRYRSFGVAWALAAVLAGCSGVPPHPAGWPRVAAGVWATVSGAGPERYQYTSVPTDASLPDLASSLAIATVQRYRGARLLSSKPFGPCPGEAGLARYALPHGVLLEVAFTVYNGRATAVYYERPKAVADASAVVAAFRQAVCYSL